jgi:hypothetical protein
MYQTSKSYLKNLIIFVELFKSFSLFSFVDSAASVDSLSKANIVPEMSKSPFRAAKEFPPEAGRKRRVSGPASTRKSSLDPIAKSEDVNEIGKSFEEARDQLEEGFFLPCRPSGGKRISCREDSVESSGMCFPFIFLNIQGSIYCFNRFFISFLDFGL